MQDKTKFEFFGMKAEAEGALAIKVTGVLLTFGLFTILIISLA